MKLFKKSVFFAFLFFALSVHAFGGENFISFKKIKLDNGINVILREDHSHPLVSVGIYVKASSLTENEKTAGISHFFEHMFFRGTELRSGMQMKREIETLGGVVNAETNKDFTRYYVDVPSRYLEDVLDIFSDALINAKFSPTDIESERKIILEEYRLNMSSPLSCIYSELYDLAFEEHPYKKAVIGKSSNIEKFKRDDFLSYKSMFYAPENIAIVVVGDFITSDIMPLIKENFGIMAKSEAYKTSYKTKSVSSAKTTTSKKDISEGMLAIGFRSPAVSDTSAIYPLDVLTFILGQGEGSILNMLKERCKLSIISADFITSKEPGLFIITAAFAPEKAEEVKKAVLGELEKIKEGKLLEDDYLRGKNLLINTFIFQNETNSGKVGTLGFYEAIYDPNFALTYLDKIKKVTKNDVIKTANEIFNNSYVCVVYLPR